MHSDAGCDVTVDGVTVQRCTWSVAPTGVNDHRSGPPPAEESAANSSPAPRIARCGIDDASAIPGTVR